MLGPLHILTICLFVGPLVTFGFYGLMLSVFHKQRNSKKGANPEHGGQISQPKVSVLVPTHNEEHIISKKIENLLTVSYPIERIEFIFMDDSDDSTPNIIQEYSNQATNVRLFHSSSRMGYSASMIAGCKLANGEILIFNDAGSFLEKSTINDLVRHFQDPQIGAVTGRSELFNKDESVGRSEDWYLRVTDFVRTAETNIDSTFRFNGEACAVRKELVSDLSSCPATFDTAVALHVRRKGYKTIYDPRVIFHEYAPRTHTERIKQKTIRATNLIRILLQSGDMIFRKKYAWFGCFILPMNLAMLAIIPVVILSSIASLTLLTFFDPAFALRLWGLLGFALLLSVIFGRKMVVTFLEFEYSLLKAFWHVFFRKRSYDKIETIASTRR